jgi:hypothetical protein
LTFKCPPALAPATNLTDDGLPLFDTNRLLEVEDFGNLKNVSQLLTELDELEMVLSAGTEKLQRTRRNDRRAKGTGRVDYADSEADMSKKRE